MIIIIIIIIYYYYYDDATGEHITGLYSETNEGKLAPLKADQDVLNLKEHEIVVVEIKD